MRRRTNYYYLNSRTLVEIRKLTRPQAMVSTAVTQVGGSLTGAKDTNDRCYSRAKAMSLSRWFQYPLSTFTPHGPPATSVESYDSLPVDTHAGT